MRLLHVCTYYANAKPVYDVYIQGPAQPKHYRTAMRVFLPTAVIYWPAQHYRTAMRVFLPQQSSTGLRAVACNLGKLNTGAKIHYTARFALIRGYTADYLATCSYLLKCCSISYATVRSITLFCTHATRVYTCINEQARAYQLGSPCKYIYARIHVRVISACTALCRI